MSLVTSERGLAGQRGDIDVAILFGDGRSKHGEAHRLFREEVFPVCSPRLVEGLQLPLAKAHLARLPMLHLKPAQHARWFDWPALFEALAIDRQPIPAVLSFDNYTLLIQAAIAGQGVAIGWRHRSTACSNRGCFAGPLARAACRDTGTMRYCRSASGASGWSTVSSTGCRPSCRPAALEEVTMNEYSTPRIQGFHAHVYFDAQSIERARALCEEAARRFPLKMGGP